MNSKTLLASAVFAVTSSAGLPTAWAADAACINAPASKALVHSTRAGTSGLAGDVESGGLLNFDRYRKDTATVLAAVPSGFEGRQQSVLFDRHMGLPTFLWAQKTAVAMPVGALTEREQLIARARAHLKTEAANLKLTDALIDDALASDAQYNGNGPAVVCFKQRVNGKEVFGRSLNVLLDRSGKPIAVSGYFATDFAPAAVPGLGFARSAPQAISAAWASLGGGALNLPSIVRTAVKGVYELYSVPLATGSHVFERDPRVKAIYYPRNGRLEPAYYVELFALARVTHQLSAYALIVSAADGGILYRRNLSSKAAFSYRVFADSADRFQPFDAPLGNGYTPFPGTDPTAPLVRTGVATNLVTLENAGLSTNDPWLAAGATETLGNHVDACLDVVDTPVSGIISSPLNTCMPELGDIRAQTNGPSRFDYPVEADKDPSTSDAQNAAVVSLFYINNWLHDWWYDHGFNEEAGNAQTSNFGRGGEEGDPIKAQGQDASGRNNANMSTPADGSSPTMQQYLFDGPVIGEVRELTPVDGAKLKFSTASFGPATFDVSGAVLLASDGSGEATDGCGLVLPDPVGLGLLPALPAPPQPALLGKIAMIDRGSCSFTTKAQFALASGAIGMIVVNNTDADPINMGNADIPISVGESPTDAIYQIPSVMIRRDDGEAIKTQLAAGTAVTMHMLREPSIDADGTLDNQIVSHEYFHYVHNRLTVSDSNQSGSMGEGWGDIDAFMLSTRPDDRLVPGNDKFQGAVGLAGYVVNNFFVGIRRAPYSTTFTNNAFTFKHISDGEPTPDGGAGATNSEVHASGEIWANMVWECYTGLLNDPRHSFAEAQNRMKDYIIGGLKMTPDNATFTEARDAILSVVLARDFKDYENCSDGFARRGNGLNAIAPDRDSTDHVGVTEDYTPFVCKATVVPPSPPPIGPAPVPTAGRFGGALNLLLLLPLLGLGLLRRRRLRR